MTRHEVTLTPPSMVGILTLDTPSESEALKWANAMANAMADVGATGIEYVVTDAAGPRVCEWRALEVGAAA